MTSLFPPRESLVVTSRLGTGNFRTFFLRCKDRLYLITGKIDQHRRKEDSNFKTMPESVDSLSLYLCSIACTLVSLLAPLRMLPM